MFIPKASPGGQASRAEQAMWNVVERHKERADQGRREVAELRAVRQAYTNRILRDSSEHIEQERQVWKAKAGVHAAQAMRTRQGRQGKQESLTREQQKAADRQLDWTRKHERVQDLLQGSRMGATMCLETEKTEQEELRQRAKAERAACQKQCQRLRKATEEALREQVRDVRTSLAPHLARGALHQQRLAQATSLRMATRELRSARESAILEQQQRTKRNHDERLAAKFIGEGDTQAMQSSQSFAALSSFASQR